MAKDDEIFDLDNLDKGVRKLGDVVNKLREADDALLKLSNDALTLSKNLSGITLPSDLQRLNSENSALTAKVKELSDALAKLQAQYGRLNPKQSENAKLTAQERYERSILNRNAREAAILNSNLAGAYAKLNVQHTQAARLLQDLIARGKLATQTQREYNKELKSAQADFDKLNQKILAADRAVGRFNRNVGNYPKQAYQGLKDLIGAFGIAGGVQLFANIVKDIFETTKEIQSLDLALKQVVQTNEQFARSQAFLSRVSEAYGANINDLTKQFTQFYVSAKDKISGREIEQIFESITKAGATMGLSQQQQERAFLALNQMMSKGTIQAEELRGQLGEALPGALGIMAKSLGVTEKQLGQMMKDGQVLAADVLPKFAKQLEITYGIEQVKRVETLAAAQGRLSNTWIEFVRTLNESESGGITQFFSSILQSVNWLLEGLVNINKSLKAIRTEFINEATTSTIEYLESVQKASEKEALAILTRKDATKNIKELNEQLAQLNHEYALLDEIKPLNFLPGRIARLKAVEKEIEQINASLGTQKGRLLGAQQVLDEMYKKDAPKAQSELTKAQLKAIEDALKAKYDAAKKEIELEILKQETILNGEYSTQEERLKALQRYNTLKQQLITLDYNEHVRLAKGNADKIKSAELDMQMAVIKQTTDSASKRTAINKRYADEYIQDLKDIEDFLKKYNDDEIARKEAADDLDVKIFNAKMARWEKEYDRLQELKQASKEYLESFSGEFFSNAGFGETFETFFKKIDDGTGKMTTKFRQLLEGAGADKWKVYFEGISQTAQETFNFLSQLTEKNFDQEKTRLDDQYNIALKYAGDNKEAQEKLAADLEKRKKEIAIREAKAKKQQALFNIAIDTAQAVVEALPNYVLAAIIAGIGLAQIAVVNAQEIPQYYMGGIHDGGKMMINDGKGANWKETYVTPDGKIHQSDKRNAIVDAPKGTKIYTHDQWLDHQREISLHNMLKTNNIDMYSQRADNSGMTKDDLYEVMYNTLGRQPISKNVWDERGYSNYTERKDNITRKAYSRAKGKS